MKIKGYLILLVVGLAWVAHAQTIPPSGTPQEGAGKNMQITPVNYQWTHAGGDLLAASFSADSQTALSVNSDGLIKFWSTQTGRMVRSMDYGAPVVAAAFYGNKKIALAMGRERENTLVLMNVETGETVETPSGHTRSVTALAFSPNGESLLSAGGDRRLMLWGTSYGEVTHLFRGHKEVVKTIALSPDGERILSSDADNTVKLWDIQTGKNVLSFTPHKKEVSGVVFSPDGQTMLSAGLDKIKPAPVYSLKLWDFSQKRWWQIRKKPIAEFGESTEPITTVAFSPDGKRILAGTKKGKMETWDLTTREKTQSFENPGEVDKTAFSRDGRFVLTAGEGKLYLWKTGIGGEETLAASPGTKPKAPQGKGKKGKGRRGK